MGTTLDHASPRKIAGNATARPASGPAAAMSKSEFRSRAGERIRMIAPRVPNPKGAGMKYGRLTAAREDRGVAEGPEAVDQELERAPRLDREHPAEHDNAAAHLPVAHDQDVLDVPAQLLLGDEHVFRRRHSRPATRASGPQAHDLRLPR